MSLLGGDFRRTPMEVSNVDVNRSTVSSKGSQA